MVDDTRNKIIAVASKLFGRYGFYKTSMDEIAKIARKAKGSLYYHFTDKKELFRVVVSTEMENFKEKLGFYRFCLEKTVEPLARIPYALGNIHSADKERYPFGFGYCNLGFYHVLHHFTGGLYRIGISNRKRL